MNFTYDIPEEIVPALKTQVVDLSADLKLELDNRIAILLQKAREEALIRTEGSIDVPALVVTAGMEPMEKV